MDNHSYKLETVQAIFFILIVMTNKIILNLPKRIIQSTNSGALLNTIYTGVIGLMVCIFICKIISQFPNYDILDISEYLGGKFLKTIIALGFIFLFVLVSAIVVISFSSLLSSIYFKNSPILFVMLFFVIGAAIANRYGFKAIVKTNVIIIPFILISILIMILGISKTFVFERIFPILGKNVETTFLIGTSNIFAYSGFSYLYLIYPFLKKKNDIYKVSILSFLISWIFLFLSIFSLIMALPYVYHSEEINSTYIVSRVVEFGSFLQRLDALFIYIWILSSLSYISISIFFILFILKKLLGLENEKNLSFSLCAMILGLALLPQDFADVAFIENTVFKYHILIFAYGICLSVLILAIIKHKVRKHSDNF